MLFRKAGYTVLPTETASSDLGPSAGCGPRHHGDGGPNAATAGERPSPSPGPAERHTEAEALGGKPGPEAMEAAWVLNQRGGLMDVAKAILSDVVPRLLRFV